MRMPKKILILSNHYITIFAFRRELVARMCAAGHHVYISSPYDERNKYFEDLGCTMIDTPMSRRGMNPVEDMKLVKQYKTIMQQLRPDIIFSYTIKPNIYGTMASNALGMKQVCNITGTGATFLKENALSKIVRVLYKLSIKKCYKVFFQNTGDRDYFVKHGMVKDNFAMLPGSGVNLSQHKLTELPDSEEIRFIYVGRVMAVKGIDEYLECARKIREILPNTKFYIAGFTEEEKYKTMVKNYEAMGVVEDLGFQDDIDPWFRRCHCVILPSLGGEGVPNALLEAAATGRACIASDINGSTDVIEDGVTGYIFEKGNAQSLIEKVQHFMSLSYEQKRQMGLNGHDKVAREFNREIVISRYLQELE
jgi:galacturonosyltransferase